MIIDVRAELEEFEWTHARWTHDKLIAASPFRFDRSPSFFVRLESYGDIPAGVWADAGAFDDDWRSGTLTKLLAFLRNETEEETTAYLRDKYCINSGENDTILLKTPILLKNKRQFTLNSDIINPKNSKYLTSRGINVSVQQKALTGQSRYKGFTAIPWYTPNGKLANVKYRSTRSKTFFYEPGAWPIGELVYGAHMLSEPTENLVICEAEIDALSWWTAGIPAIAVGGVAFSDKQADIIRRLPFDTLVLAGDNDSAGQKFNDRVKRSLRGVQLRTVDWREGTEKDANDVLRAKGAEALRNYLSNSTLVGMNSYNGISKKSDTKMSSDMYTSLPLKKFR